jgi:hypothetical protein
VAAADLPPRPPGPNIRSPNKEKTMALLWIDEDGNSRSDPPTLADAIKSHEKSLKAAREAQQDQQPDNNNNNRLDGGPNRSL